MKRSFRWTALSITGTFEEQKIPVLMYDHFWISQTSWFGKPFPPKDLIGVFSDAKQLLQCSIWTFFADLRLYKKPRRILETPRDSCKTASVHTERLKYFISLMKVSMIVSLPWIIASIRMEATWIGLPTHTIWLLATFSSGSIPERRGVLPSPQTNWNNTSLLHVRPFGL